MLSLINSSKSRRSRSWNSLAWILGWLTGVALLSWVCITWAVPRVEHKLVTRVQSAVAPTTDSPILVTVKGHVATLAGSLGTDAERESLVAAALTAPGIRRVNDQLTMNVATADTESSGLLPAGTDASNAAPTMAGPEGSQNDNSEPLSPDSVSATAADEPHNGENTSQLSPDSVPTSEANTGSAAQAEPEALPLAQPDSTATPVEPEAAPDTQSDSMTAPTDIPAAVNSARPPELRLAVTDNTLTMSGQLSAEDDLAALTRGAMNSFELDYVSNSIDSTEDVAAANWIEPLASLMPTLSGLENPSIDVIDQQITISGAAQDQNEHDRVVDDALASLGEFSLVERISVRQESTPQALRSDTDAPAAPAATTAEPSDGATAGVSQIANEPGTIKADSQSVSDTDTAAPAGAGEADSTSDNNPKTNTAPVGTIKESMSGIDLTGILFEPSSDRLTPESLDTLDQVAGVLAQFPDVPISIDGHTDTSGAAADNLTLSQLRANRVRDYLVNQGVSVYRLKARGFGEGVPLQNNETPEGRAANRRIEFTY